MKENIIKDKSFDFALSIITVHSKISIASKEARETYYWLRLLQKSQVVKMDFSKQLSDIEEIIRIITTIVKSSQN